MAIVAERTLKPEVRARAVGRMLRDLAEIGSEAPLGMSDAALAFAKLGEARPGDDALVTSRRNTLRELAAIATQQQVDRPSIAPSLQMFRNICQAIIMHYARGTTNDDQAGMLAFAKREARELIEALEA
jgi:hypothetical protein